MPAESASSFNQPNRIDAWIFEPGEKRSVAQPPSLSIVCLSVIWRVRARETDS